MKKSYLAIGVALVFSMYSCQTDDVITDDEVEVFKTYSTSASIKSNDVVEAQLASYLDEQNNTHIVWVETNGSSSLLNYTKFSASNKQFSTELIAPAVADQRFYGVDIVTDALGAPHVSYVVQGTVAGNTSNAGNVQVFYAKKSGGAFTSTQVSTNDTDPTSNTDSIFNAYGAIRPSISVASDGTPSIVYLADNSPANGNAHQMIVATLQNGQWGLATAQNVGQLSGTFDNTAGFATPAKGAVKYAGFIDVTNYEPSYIYKSGNNWTEVVIPNYSGATANLHAQLVADNQGGMHYFWFNDPSNKMCHTILSEGTYSVVEETSISEDHVGTFFPATIDRASENIVYYYEDIADGFLVYTDAEGTQQTYKLEGSSLGQPMGRQVLNANGGYVSVVLGDVVGQQLSVVVTNE